MTTNATSTTSHTAGEQRRLPATSALVIFVYALFCIGVAAQPIIWLLGYIADDGFYYLQIARHIASTGISTFDGINPTNGYHPGWMALMSALACCFHTREGLVRAAVFTALALHGVAAFLLAKLLGRYVPARAAWLGACGWLLNPYALRIMLTGTEAPLLLAMVLATVLGYLAILDRNTPITLRASASLGAALGACILSRTDQVFLAVLILGHVLYRAWRSGGASDGSRNLGAALKTVIIAGVVCILVVMPWLIYSYHSVGTLRQDSSEMKTLWAAALPFGGPNTPPLLGALGFTIGSWLLQPAVGLGGASPETQEPIVFLVCLAIIVLGSRSAKAHPAWRSATGLLIPVWGLLLVVGVLYGLYVKQLQIWHLAETALALYATMFLMLVMTVTSASSPKTAKIVWTVTVLFILAPIFRGTILKASYPWQRDVYRHGAGLYAHAPAGARIGCFNTGIPAYFSDREIINLDGLVNHAAVPYWKAHRFDEYLRDAHIDYIADEDYSLARGRQFSHGKLPTKVIATTPLTGWDPPVRSLFRIVSTPAP